MTCFHPLKGFIKGINQNGKKDLIITSYETDHIEIYNGVVKHVVNKYVQTDKPSKTKVITDYITIPCGQCIGCRVDKSREWANRMMFELEYHEKACFITLTYDDEHVPRSQYVDNDGVINQSLTLKPEDLQKFWKRLRFALKDKNIRYYACGEYGDETKRPHYHAIIYGINFDFDRFLLKLSKENNAYYRSPLLEKVWPFGYSMVTDVTWNTCAYVARYVTKKKTGFKKDYYTFFNISPEFSTMSRRPGIGYQWFQDHKEKLYLYGETYIPKGDSVIKAKPPAYFDKLYDIDHHEELEEIKEARRAMAENQKRMKLEKTNLSYIELLAAEEENFKQRIKTLRRNKN